MPVATILRRIAVHLVPDDVFTNYRDRRLQLGGVYERPLPGTPPSIQRRQHCSRRMGSADRVPEVHSRLHRRVLVQVAVHRRDSTHLLLPDSVLYEVPPRPGVPERGHRQHDNVRPQTPECLVVETPARQQAGAKVLHHNVADCHQLLDHGFARGMSNLTRDPIFRHVQRVEPPGSVPGIVSPLRRPAGCRSRRSSCVGPSCAPTPP